MVHTHTVDNRVLPRIKQLIKIMPLAEAESINWMVYFDDAVLNL